MPDVTEFKAGMRRLLSGVSLITTTIDGAHYGLVATSVSSLSVEPPSLLVCVNQKASCHDPISESGAFCVSVLAEGHRDLSQLFSSSAMRAARFASGPWHAMATGCPAVEDALAAFDCKVTERLSIHSHTVFVGEVVHTRLLQADLPDPLAYYNGGYVSIAGALIEG
jgi:flavin reductase